MGTKEEKPKYKVEQYLINLKGILYIKLTQRIAYALSSLAYVNFNYYNATLKVGFASIPN